MASKTELREGSKYFVVDPDNVGVVGKRIPLVCHYRGVHPDPRHIGFRHLFTFVGDPDTGYNLTDKMVLTLVEPYSEARNAEIAKEAEYYYEQLKLWRKAARKQSPKRSKTS
jgi:hypothetical protein